MSLQGQQEGEAEVAAAVNDSPVQPPPKFLSPAARELFSQGQPKTRRPKQDGNAWLAQVLTLETASRPGCPPEQVPPFLAQFEVCSHDWVWFQSRLA